MKKALTYSVIAGSRSCVNSCPICISEMTPDYGIGTKEPYVDWEKFRKATRIARNHGAENVLITSKGEATLFPYQVTRYLHEIEREPFDRRELQTEGSVLATGGRLYDEFLRVWKDHGLDVIAVSIYHYDSAKNAEMFRPKSDKQYDLAKFVKKLDSHGLGVRLSCVMMEGCIDTPQEVDKLIDFSRDNGVLQLTLRRADKPVAPNHEDNVGFIDKHALRKERFDDIAKYLQFKGTLCDVLPHGAYVYEIDRQNVCITTGLTCDAGEKEIRQLIFFPPGMLTTSWENIYGGRIL